MKEEKRKCAGPELLRLIEEIEKDNNDLNISFNYKGIAIYFPTVDEEGTYPVDPLLYYGETNISKMVLEYLKLGNNKAC